MTHSQPPTCRKLRHSVFSHSDVDKRQFDAVKRHSVTTYVMLSSTQAEEIFRATRKSASGQRGSLLPSARKFSSAREYKEITSQRTTERALESEILFFLLTYTPLTWEECR